jgi:hypothetical protein
MNGHCVLNSALVLVKLGSTAIGEFELSFALLFGFIQPFLPKELSQNFAPIPGAGHATSRAELLEL